MSKGIALVIKHMLDYYRFDRTIESVKSSRYGRDSPRRRMLHDFVEPVSKPLSRTHFLEVIYPVGWPHHPKQRPNAAVDLLLPPLLRVLEA